MANLQALTSPTLIVNGDPVEASKPNGLVNNAGGLLETVTLLANQREVTSGNSNVTVIANQDVMIFCNNTANIIVTLPSANTQLVNKKIRIKKTQNNLNTVIITCAGSDTIENPNATIGTPVNTTLTLVLPGESVTLEPFGNTWRVVTYYSRPEYIYARAFRNATQSLSAAAFQKINFNAETSDAYNLFDSTTNFRFTCPVTGIYEVSASVALAPAGGASDSVASIYKNGVEIARGSRNNMSQAINTIVFTLYEEVTATTDFFEIFCFNSTTARTVEAGAGSTYGIFNLKRRT